LRKNKPEFMEKLGRQIENAALDFECGDQKKITLKNLSHSFVEVFLYCDMKEEQYDFM
jgi:hypothetical protein